MIKLNRFGIQQLDNPRTSHPALLSRLEREGVLEEHPLYTRHSMEWDLEQMVTAGMDEETVELKALMEYLCTPVRQ